MKAVFSGKLNQEGNLALCATFLGQRQRFWLHDHSTGGLLVCKNVPIAVQAQDALFDRNEALLLLLSRGARFTVFAFEDGCIVAAATYAFDGQAVVEQAQIGAPIQMESKLVDADTPVNVTEALTEVDPIGDVGARVPSGSGSTDSP